MIKLDFTSMIKDIERELDKEDKRIRGKAAAYAVRAIKDAAPVVTGNLKKSIKAKSFRRSTTVGACAPLGAHGHLVEYPHDIVRNGVKVGESKGQPFMGPTFESITPELIKIMSEERLK